LGWWLRLRLRLVYVLGIQCGTPGGRRVCIGDVGSLSLGEPRSDQPRRRIGFDFVVRLPLRDLQRGDLLRLLLDRKRVGSRRLPPPLVFLRQTEHPAKAKAKAKG
jgi:hypothetical protein